MTTRPPDFDELVGEDLPADERARLRGVHDLLVAAGPPAELSPGLERAPSVGDTVHFLPRRRRGAVLLLAAALAAAAFGGGFLTGAVTHRSASKSTALVIQMHGTAAVPNARASIALLTADKAGNWPMHFTVLGLPKLPHGGYYELYVTKQGRITASCGVFNVHGGRTTVTLNAPYTSGFDGWVVTKHLPGRPELASRPVLTT
jgi:Anti-sigma-K factor rskA, C-terminal